MKFLLTFLTALSITMMISGCECLMGGKKADGTCAMNKGACTCPQNKCMCSAKAETTIKKLNSMEMMAAAKDTSVTIVDARGKATGMEMVPNAIPLSFQAPDQEILDTLKDKNARIVTYCANVRCSASPKLAERLVKLGYKNVSEYPEGIQGWKSATAK